MGDSEGSGSLIGTSTEDAEPRRRRGLLVAIVAIVILALAAGVGGALIGLSDSGTAVGTTDETTPSGDPNDLTPEPLEPASTEADPALDGPRTCWNGSKITGADTCPIPEDEEGMIAVSPTFAEALEDGRCRLSPDDHTEGGYLCDVDGVDLHFAWFETVEDQDLHFDGIYPRCKRFTFLLDCKGPDREAIRYADYRFLFEVTSAKSDVAALRATKMIDSERILQGRP